MKTMTSIKAFGPGDLRLVSVAIPQPGPGEVLVRNRVCGICGSDKWFWNVQEPTDYVAGHEACGEVVELGPGCRSIKTGDRVAINNVKGCGTCPECMAGEFVRCQTIQHMGHGFSEYLVVPERNILVLEPSIDFEAGSLIFDLWGTPWAALERLGELRGTTLVLSGCGPIGLAGLALAISRGARVVAIDPMEDRLRMARELGADLALVPGADNLAELRDWSKGRGADFFLECSGKASAYLLAWDALRIGGTLMTLGEGACFTMKPSEHIINKHLTWMGSLYSSIEEGRKVQDMMVQGAIKAKCLVTHRFVQADLPEVFGSVVQGGEGLLKTLVLFP